MSDHDRSEFERRVRQALLDSSDALDGRTRSKLTQARYAALETAASVGAVHAGATPADAARSGAAQRGDATTHRAAWRWAPAGAVAAVMLVTVIYVSHRTVVTPADDMVMLADADLYALHAESEQEPDYDFYEWAAATAESDGETGS